MWRRRRGRGLVLVWIQVIPLLGSNSSHEGTARRRWRGGTAPQPGYSFGQTSTWKTGHVSARGLVLIWSQVIPSPAATVYTR
jgi:hypothetical protein